MRLCPFSNCDKTVPSDTFACRKHWFSLNYNQRQRIHKAYADYLAEKIDMEEIAKIQQRVLDEVQGVTR